MVVHLANSPLHYRRWEVLRDILWELADKETKVSGADIYNHTVSYKKVTSEGLIMIGFMGLLVLADERLRAEEKREHSDWIFQKDQLVYVPKIRYHETVITRHIMNPTALIEAASVWLGVHIDLVEVMAAYWDSKKFIQSMVGPNKVFVNPDTYYPCYVITAHWNSHRADIITTPISALVMAENINAMLNWASTGEKRVPQHAGWRYYNMN